MAAGSLLALLDDIASILDDVSVLTKTAASKTAGVLGDDLALNAQQVSGVVAKRELPVVWGVAKGSFVNKLILVPLALLISAFAPWAVTPLLMVGGLYLCFEGCEKLVHKFLHRKKKTVEEARVELATLDASPESEKEKIKGAIRTDFVLSAEIIAITLGTVAESDFLTRVLVLHRETRRSRPLPEPADSKRFPGNWPGHHNDGSPLDEISNDRGNCRNVSGRRRHFGAWHPPGAS